MSKPKTYETEVFEYNYKIFDAAYGDIVRSITTSDMEEVYREYLDVISRHGFYFKKSPFYSNYNNKYERFFVLDHFDELVDPGSFSIYAKRKNFYRLRNTVDIRYKKGNPNKVKRGYYDWEGYYYEDGRFYNPEPNYYEYPYKANPYRKVRTYHEFKATEDAVEQWDETLVRSKRRIMNLPSSWDDLRNTRLNAIKSWKHNSKRRKQYKVIDKTDESDFDINS